MKKKLTALVLMLVACSVYASSDADPNLTALEGTQWESVFRKDKAFTIRFKSVVDQNGRLYFTGQTLCNNYSGSLYHKEGRPLASSFVMTKAACQGEKSRLDDLFAGFMKRLSSVDLEGELIRIYSEGVGYMMFKKIPYRPFYRIDKLSGSKWKAKFFEEDFLKPTTVYFKFARPSTLSYIVVSETGFVVSGSFVVSQNVLSTKDKPTVFGEPGVDFEERAELEELLERISKTAGFYVSGSWGERSLRWVDKNGKVIMEGFKEASFE